MDKLLSYFNKLREWWVNNRRVLLFTFIIVMAAYGTWMVFGRLLILSLCLYIAYYAATHRSELARTRFQDYINPLKWGSVLFASFMKMLFPLHIVEQLILRMYDMECRKCVANGSCFHCGCDISKVYTPWDVCSRGFWGQMVESLKEYKRIRQEWPVEISVRYPREEEESGKGFYEFINEGGVGDYPGPATSANPND